MPVNRKWPVAELMAAVARYIAKTNRKVFFEYVMLDGVNDRPQDAEALARLMRGPLYHVNLIPYNSTPDAQLGAAGDAAHPRVQRDPRSEGRGVHRAHPDGPRHRRRVRPAPRRDATARPHQLSRNPGSGRCRDRTRPL